MGENSKVTMIRAAGFMIGIGAVSLGFWLMPDSKAFLTMAFIALLTWYIGKLTGQPLPIVTIQAVRSLPPKRAQQAFRILSHPPKADYEHWETEEESKTPITRTGRPH